MSQRLQTNETDEIVVTFDPGVCIPSGALQFRLKGNAGPA